jgi:hypothetical protein
MFNLERNEYAKRREKAMTLENISKPSILSIIIDGADQKHCNLPYLGSQNSFPHPFKVHLTGIKEHGNDITLYPTISTVKKGINLNI